MDWTGYTWEIRPGNEHFKPLVELMNPAGQSVATVFAKQCEDGNYLWITWPDTEEDSVEGRSLTIEAAKREAKKAYSAWKRKEAH